MLSLSMTLHGSNRWRVPPYLPVAFLVIIVGLLHRRAAIDAWADDRSLAAQPSWLQMGAPLWHSAVNGSFSIANALTQVVDPLTGASTLGDIRALAAMLSALGAGTLLLLLKRAGAPVTVALALCCALVGLLLPVAAAVSATHALQMFLGAALILTWSASRPRAMVRLGLLAAITVFGAANHASFLAFAAGLWMVELARPSGTGRARVGIVAAIALTSGLLVAAWLLQLNVSAPFAISLERPGTLATAIGIVTGRFTGHLQPAHDFDLRSSMSLCLPAPLILCVPLAALGFARRETRSLAVACAIAAAASIIFIAGMWLPDPRVAAAPARAAALALIGLGLSWVATQPGRGAMALAIAASVLIGTRGFIEPPRWTVPVDAAKMQAFVEAAPEQLAGAAWSADHLAVGRALLGAHGDIGASRIPARADVVGAVPPDRPVIALSDVAQPSSTTSVVTAPIVTAPFDVSYSSAARFLASQPERMWIAIAARGLASSGFCGDLLAQLGADAQTLAGANPTLLAHIGTRNAQGRLSGSDRLDVEYARAVDGASEAVPARFGIEATPSVRILVNARAAVRTDQGMAIATFDPWTSDVQTWTVASCDAPIAPIIRDRRLGAAYLLEPGALPQSPPIPVVSRDPVQIRFGDFGGDWFVTGWNGPEGRGDEAFRWTSATDAQINVAVSHRQPVRVRMHGALATAGGMPNALGLSWNGAVIRPLGPWPGGADDAWTVPEALVRRGVNVFTVHVAYVVSPAASGTSTDSRTLGAAIHGLSFEPAPSAR
jgi:hypothetical protein